ncbi:DUF917 domain-containing protein [Brevibacillus massiliensis]|uniref:DUF917 domain-containing protein n=1 Tax=Brevibacillus massiliensis TaxID=1118054 RepID=UPI0004744BDE|nr:DUF917 domain-containing protein [Brevibacillus massiliensis]
MNSVIQERDIPSLACGARYLGSGGGGNSYLLQLLTMRAIRDCGPVPFVSALAMDEGTWSAPVAIMGSPSILNEKILTGVELLQAVQILEEQAGIRIDALMGLEIGGLNALTPVLAAALSGRPLLDSDGMGRAFTELQMTTFHAFGVSASPLVMVNEQGRWEHIATPSNWDVEWIARRKVIDLGGWATIASYPMKLQQVKEVGIHQSFSLAKRLGDSVIAAKEDIHQVMKALVQIFSHSLYGRPAKLIEGKVVELERRITGGMMNGMLVIEGEGEHIGEQLEVVFQNEFLLAKQGDRLIATVPDLLCVLDVDNGFPIVVEEMENHKKVWVVAIPAHPLIRHSKMLQTVGPKRYGLAKEFIPLEQLRQSDDREAEGHVSAGY